MTTAAGLNSAGLGLNGTGGLVRVTSAGNLELAGNVTSGATIRQTFGAGGQLLSEQYDWSGRDSRIEIDAQGRALIGTDTTNELGQPIQAGAFLRASERIDIRGGSHPSGTGVLIYAASELSTNNPDGAIVIDAAQDAEILGVLVAGGRLEAQRDADGGYLGRRIVRFGGDSTLRIEADQQIRIGQDLVAGKQIDLIGGLDPVVAGEPLSGRGAVLYGSRNFAPTGRTA